MAFRLSDYVSYGELVCTHHYAVTGFLVLRTRKGEATGDHFFVRLELTGLPDPYLIGKHICFEPEDGAAVSYFEPSEHPRINTMQIGATGTIKASGWVRTLPCSVEEYMTRSRLGEPPPTEWKNHVYIEWFGQHGRMVVELGGVLVERCTRARDLNDESDMGEWEPLPNPEPRPEPYVHRPEEVDPDSFVVHEIRSSGEVITHHGGDLVRDDGGLQRHLDEEAEAIDRAIRGEEDDDDEDLLMMETSLIDECIENEEETPLMELLRGLGPLPRPETLSDEAVEDQFKIVVANLALFGIGFSVCEHFNPREAYTLLLDVVLPDSGAFEGLIGTGWTQNFMTSEYCTACDEEAERRFEQYQKTFEEQREQET